MKGGVYEYSEAEQRLREFIAAKRAEFSFKQKVEKQRWEQETLVPLAKDFQEQLNRGTADTLELPDAS